MEAITPDQAKALEIIAAGEVYESSWHDEGDAESGPMGGTHIGYRHDDDMVELTTNGSVVMWLHDDDRCVGISNSVLIRYTGIGVMIADHLRALASNSQRNGLDFVKTGCRPTAGYYSLDEIMAREEMMRS